MNQWCTEVIGGQGDELALIDVTAVPRAYCPFEVDKLSRGEKVKDQCEQ